MDDWIIETVHKVMNEDANRYLNQLINETNSIFHECDQILNETEESKNQLREIEEYMRITEDRLETIRRDRNKAAVILWNFPDDLHPTIAYSTFMHEKIEAIFDFFVHTIGIVPQDLEFMDVEHVTVFFTNYKSQRSVNVRIQFVDEEAKLLCESQCIPFLKMFNQNRTSPTRWKDDQTELQREEIAKQQQQQQNQMQMQMQQPPAVAAQQARPQRLLFTKFIQWPPRQ